MGEVEDALRKAFPSLPDPITAESISQLTLGTHGLDEALNSGGGVYHP